MESISEYIESIFSKFESYVLSCNNLCDLLDVNFESDKFPNYFDVHVQELYLLRYAFAYAFEYKVMFKELLNKSKFGSCIDVTSMGCGSMIDYWGLACALEELNLQNIINYNGIDIVKWNYQVASRDVDNIYFHNVCINDYFLYNDENFSDIYIFPKSIGEFSDDDITCICNYFKLNNSKNDKIYLMIAYSSAIQDQLRKIDEIKMAISSIGFKIITHNYDYLYKYYRNIGITMVDNNFKYPSRIIEFCTHLYEKCNKSEKMMNCDNDKCSKALNKYPILKAKYTHYQIIEFERE